jgi:hypothetical protein
MKREQPYTGARSTKELSHRVSRELSGDETTLVSRTDEERPEFPAFRRPCRPSQVRVATGLYAPFEGRDRTTENRGAPGSSPGLAISRGRNPAWELDSLLVGGMVGELVAVASAIYAWAITPTRRYASRNPLRLVELPPNDERPRLRVAFASEAERLLAALEPEDAVPASTSATGRRSTHECCALVSNQQIRLTSSTS